MEPPFGPSLRDVKNWLPAIFYGLPSVEPPFGPSLRDVKNWLPAIFQAGTGTTVGTGGLLRLRNSINSPCCAMAS